MQTETVHVAGPGGDFKAYLALPEKTPAPGVLVVQEIFGVNEHIRDVTRRVAAQGYVALAPHLYWRLDPDFACAYDAEGTEKARAARFKVDLDLAVDDVKASLALLRSRPETTARSGLIGFCWGGLIAYLSACRLDLDVISSFYGGFISDHLAEAEGMRSVPAQFHFGEKDAAIPLDQIAQIEKRLAPSADCEVFTYGGADHGFFCDQRGSYHAESAKQAWERTLRKFQAHLQR